MPVNCSKSIKYVNYYFINMFYIFSFVFVRFDLQFILENIQTEVLKYVIWANVHGCHLSET